MNSASPVVPVIQEPDLPLLPDLDFNFANDADVLAYVRNSIFPVLGQTRSDRQALEDEWKEVRNMALQRHDSNQRYLGRSQAYVPAYARARTTFVSQLARGLFPSDEYMDVVPVDQRTTPEEAQATKQLLRHEFEKGMRLRTGMKPFLRQFVDVGFSVGKLLYAKEETYTKRLTLLRQGESYETMAYKEGCRFYTRNVFNWYIYPVTANSVAEAQVVFEDILVPRAMFAEKDRKGKWANVREAMESAPAETTQQIQEMLNAQADHTSPLSEPQAGELGVRVVTEVWTTMPLPRKGYAMGEDVGAPVPVKLTLCGATVLEARRNPFWHQCAPYVCARDEWEVGSFYPRGQGHRVKHLQTLLNDFTNQLNDNGTYALNPMVKVNPSLLSGPLTPMRPGGIWSGTDVDQMAKFDRPPVEQLQYGLQLVNTYGGMLVDYMGTPPIIQGIAAGKAGKTATQSQILQRNAMNPLQDIVEDIEIDVLQQLMEMAYSLNQQYRSDESMEAVAGMSVKMPKEMLYGRYAFHWMASSQAVNQQQRAQGIMQMLQMMGPLLPVLMQNGYAFDPVPWLKRLATDGFGLRQFDEVVFKQQQAPGMPGMPPQMGPGGHPPPQASPPEVRSATEQGGGEGGIGMQPGEGEDFMQVRDNADELAALLGGGGEM